MLYAGSRFWRPAPRRRMSTRPPALKFARTPGRLSTCQGVNEDGTRYFTLVDCWHPAEDRIDGIQRCYDLYGSEFGTDVVSEFAMSRDEPNLLRSTFVLTLSSDRTAISKALLADPLWCRASGPVLKCSLTLRTRGSR